MGIVLRREDITPSKVYTYFPEIKNSSLQMAIVHLSKSIGYTGIIEKNLKDDVEADKMGDDLGVRVLCEISQNPELYEKLISEITHNGKELITRSKLTMTDLDKKFQFLKQQDESKGNAKSFPDSTKRHVTFGQNIIVEIESDKSINKKSINKPLKSKPNNEELPKTDVISNSSKRNSKEKDKEK